MREKKRTTGVVKKLGPSVNACDLVTINKFKVSLIRRRLQCVDKYIAKKEKKKYIFTA
jgi:Ni2+-binding GTPase involved in maturation of urease and hydrogenase